MAEPDHTTGLTLEAAIERTGRPLKRLFEAAADWRAVEKHALILAKRIIYEPEHTNILRPQIAYERELEETTARFIRLLATGAWAIKVRRWDQLGGRLIAVRPGEASQLSVRVHPSAKSLTLHGPAGERLFYELSAPAPKPEAPAEPQQQPEVRSSADWLAWAVTTIPPDDREVGWKGRYSQKLEPMMEAAAKNNKAITAMPAASIAARIREAGGPGWPK
jgi:hypothetical protein